MTTSNNIDRFFNVHTEAMGYLSGFEKRNGRNGAFTVVTFCMIEGKASNADSLYVSCTISCPKALEILEPFGSEINNRDIKVFCGLRIAKYRAEPFMYPATSPKAGQLGVNYSSNLIRVMYLKVADREIKLPKSESQVTTDYGIPAQSKAKHVPSSAERPRQIKLSKSDPHFEVIKQRLKDDGYEWNKDEFCWELPAVTVAVNNQSGQGPTIEVPGESTDLPIRVELRKDDPNFEMIKQNLKDDGYKWNSDEECWQLPTYSVAKGDPNRAVKERDLAHLGYVDRGNGVWNVAFGRSAYQKSKQNSVQAA